MRDGAVLKKRGMKKGRRQEEGVTFLEVMVAMTLLGIIVGVGMPMVGSSKRDAERKGMEAEAKTLNDAILRVELGADRQAWLTLSNILHVQQDKDEAVEWLVDNGYVTLTEKP
jgi:prepilin-type N-terminal cleavage/methylation domain-containing protein